MIKRVSFHRNAYFSTVAYKDFMNEVMVFVNSGVEIISINELDDGHYNFSIVVWYEDKSSIKETDICK